MDGKSGIVDRIGAELQDASGKVPLASWSDRLARGARLLRIVKIR